MNLLKKLSFLLLVFCLSSNITTAQTPQVINYSDKAKIYDYQDLYILPTIFQDYDNKDNLWVSLFSKEDDSLRLCRFDNHLTLQNEIQNFGQLLNFKYNNKNYGVSFNYKVASNILCLDSIFFYCNDTNGNNIIKTLIRTSNNDSLDLPATTKNVFFDKENNIIMFHYSYATSIPKIRITKIDTMGSVIKSKDYDLTGNSLLVQSNIIDKDNYYGIVYNYTLDYYTKGTKLYHMDKNTLEMLDTLEFDSLFYIDNLRQIDDSIFVTISNCGESIVGETEYTTINIINCDNLSRKSIKYPHITNEWMDNGYIPEFGQTIDYINQDSIYFCYYSDSSNKKGFIDIVNFNINGDINFRYRIDHDSTLLFKQINGIKATTDGGVVIACSVYGSAWVIKFMPNGFVGLTDVETGEKASLKVYPNPAKDFVLVDIEADKFDEADIEIYDLGGRMVKRSTLTAKVGNRIDVSDLRAGVYGYRVVLNGKSVSGKIVIGK